MFPVACFLQRTFIDFSGVKFDLYRGHCFDGLVVSFNSVIDFLCTLALSLLFPLFLFFSCLECILWLHCECFFYFSNLDTLVYLDKDRQLQTTQYIKPINTHNYLHRRHSHLKSILSYLNEFWTCTDDKEMKKQSDELKLQFSAGGYWHLFIENQINELISNSRHDILKLKSNSEDESLPLRYNILKHSPPTRTIGIFWM